VSEFYAIFLDLMLHKSEEIRQVLKGTLFRVEGVLNINTSLPDWLLQPSGSDEEMEGFLQAEENGEETLEESGQSNEVHNEEPKNNAQQSEEKQEVTIEETKVETHAPLETISEEKDTKLESNEQTEKNSEQTQEIQGPSDNKQVEENELNDELETHKELELKEEQPPAILESDEKFYITPEFVSAKLEEVVLSISQESEMMVAQEKIIHHVEKQSSSAFIDLDSALHRDEELNGLVSEANIPKEEENNQTKLPLYRTDSELDDNTEILQPPSPPIPKK